MPWDEVSEDGYLADLNLAQPLRYDPFPSIHEDYTDRIEDLLSEVDLKDSVIRGVQNFTMSCRALHAMEVYGVTMQVEEDKARIANPRGWLVSKGDLRSLKEDIELRIFQISEEQQRLELKDRWKSQNRNSRAGALTETKQICSINIWMTTALLWMAMTFTWTSQPYSVSVTPYQGTSTEKQIWQLQLILW